MKKSLFILGGLIVIASVVSFTGCATPVATQRSNQNWGSFGDVLVPVKDFEVKGMIFTEAQFTVKTNGTIDGKVFTYQALLKEAQKVGADAIVNVIIDRVNESVTSGSGFSSSGAIKETWYGSALAIRYTTALTQGGATGSPTRSASFSGSASASGQQPLGLGFR